MAEADIIEIKLKETFQNASEYVKCMVSTLNTVQLLQLYGHYKQATVGKCTTSKPRWYEMESKQKWDAWNKLGNMSKDEAMETYVKLVTEIDPDWEKKRKSIETSDSGGSWVSVSSLMKEDDYINDSEKNIIDWVKEGNVKMVKELATSTKLDINKLDSEGLAPIHWASDRGNLDTLKYLITELNANIEQRDQDGQTALHYAASCGHHDVVKYLVESGADVKVVDNDGVTPSDISSDDVIKELLVNIE